ncbi:hypothetical protein SAMN05421811_108308 [Nonomuraea wenchangensis]|uniref:Uncharacterized protein n=1 Tax=Nonomuraea wenchangensis TaxID=568860 RepID=A0A1I0KL79_9ACTN|nr:hypothetical protein SAMN05421811_108308 [Nonomuraea wenchangensis]
MRRVLLVLALAVAAALVTLFLPPGRRWMKR